MSEFVQWWSALNLARLQASSFTSWTVTILVKCLTLSWQWLISWWRRETGSVICADQVVSKWRLTRFLVSSVGPIQPHPFFMPIYRHALGWRDTWYQFWLIAGSWIFTVLPRISPTGFKGLWFGQILWAWCVDSNRNNLSVFPWQIVCRLHPSVPICLCSSMADIPTRLAIKALPFTPWRLLPDQKIQVRGTMR